MNSLDMRRVMEAAALKHKRMNWVARWSLRWMVRLQLWRERMRPWGRGKVEKAATPAAADPTEKPPA